jgi:hypothetical protein
LLLWLRASASASASTSAAASASLGPSRWLEVARLEGRPREGVASRESRGPVAHGAARACVRGGVRRRARDQDLELLRVGATTTLRRSPACSGHRWRTLRRSFACSTGYRRLAVRDARLRVLQLGSPGEAAQGSVEVGAIPSSRGRGLGRASRGRRIRSGHRGGRR